MFVKLAVLACALAVASAAWNGPLAGGVPASTVPAGISPQACPNYPHCSNPSVAAEPNVPAPASHYNAPAYNPAPASYNSAPQYNGASNSVQEALNRGEYIGDGDYRGEGLAESGAYGQVADNQQSYTAHQSAPAYQTAPAYQAAPAYNAVPAYGKHAAVIPAGVDPSSCPNYPFCN